MRHSLLAALWCAAVAYGASADQVTVPLRNPEEPAQLEVSLVNGSVLVVGADVDAVIIELRDGDEEGDAPPGMQRVSKALRALQLEQHGNRIEISLNPASNAGLEVKVPFASTAEVSTVNGRVEVRGLTGELELHNTNGRIVASDVSGPVSASTVNGVVNVELSTTPARAEMAFSTLNGDVDVTLPEGYGANLTMSSDNGSIYTDFEVAVAGGEVPKRRGVGERMNGKINGGGPSLLLKTFNGDISLHKRKR